MMNFIHIRMLFFQVIDTLSKLSNSPFAQRAGIKWVCVSKWIFSNLLEIFQISFALNKVLFQIHRAFPTEESSENEDIYMHLADLIE